MGCWLIGMLCSLRRIDQQRGSHGRASEVSPEALYLGFRSSLAVPEGMIAGYLIQIVRSAVSQIKEPGTAHRACCGRSH